MSPILSIRHQRCPNCPPGDAAERRVVIHSRKDRRFRCTLCGTTWVMHRRQLDYRLRHPRLKVIIALRMLSAGRSIRTVAALLQVSPSTVQRWRQRAPEEPTRPDMLVTTAT